MSRWWRAYDEAVDDPKLCLLTDKQHRTWFNLCCITSQAGGTLPPIAAIAFKLRMTVPKAKSLVAELVALGLIDRDETAFAPHNWNARQFKSDVSNERVKQHRERKRNVTSAVTETPPETEQIQKQKDPAAEAAGADAPIDHRKRLFDEGLPKLAKMTGKGPDACRSFVGKCLKAAGDDAVTVLGLIEDAERNRAVDPSGWIAARLKTTEIGNGKAKYGIMEAADSLRRKVASFDGPASENLDLRDAAGPTIAGLLSQR